jgi:hypothetical protein
VPTSLLLERGSWERDNCLDQASLRQGHIISEVQARLYVLFELESRELELDLTDWILHVPLLSHLPQERLSLPTPLVNDLTVEFLVPGIAGGHPGLLESCPLSDELKDVGVLIDGPGLLIRELLRPVRIDPPQHPAGRPHQIVLWLHARDDSSGVGRHLTREVVLDVGLYLHIL